MQRFESRQAPPVTKGMLCPSSSSHRVVPSIPFIRSASIGEYEEGMPSVPHRSGPFDRATQTLGDPIATHFRGSQSALAREPGPVRTVHQSGSGFVGGGVEHHSDALTSTEDGLVVNQKIRTPKGSE